MADYGSIPQVDFSTLGDLGNVYKKARDEAELSNLGQQLAAGTIDYQQAAGLAAKAGKLDLSMQLIKMHREQLAADQFNKVFGIGAAQGGSPQGQPAPQGSVPLSSLGSPSPAAPMPRAPVASSDKVVGDAEGVRLGLYDKPATPGGVPPDQPDAMPPQQMAQAPAPTPQAAPVGPSITTNPAAKNIPALIAAVSNPGLPQPQRDAAKELLKHALDTSNLPPDQRDYNLYLAQGGKDDFTTWMRANKTAGATLINTAPGLEAEQTKARIAIDTHAVSDLSKKAVSGRSAIPLLDRMIAISDKTPEGWAGSITPTLARAAAGLGIPVTDGMSNAELMASMSRQFIPSVRDPGSTSNYEQQLYSQAVPGLAQSQPGRVKIASMFKAQIERNNEIVKIYRQNIGSPDLDAKLAALDAKPMFTEEDRRAAEAEAKKAAPAQPAQPAQPAVRINSIAERDALPPGTLYIAPDGSTRTKQ